MNHDAPSREAFTDGIAVNFAASNRRQVHPVERRNDAETVADVPLKQGDHVIATVAINAARAPDMARKVPVANELSNRNLDRDRGVPVGRMLRGNERRKRPGWNYDESQPHPWKHAL